MGIIASKDRVVARHPEWWVDNFVGRVLLRPADAVVITGFWRSGTTWLLQALARAIGAKSVFEPLHYGIDRYRQVLRNDAYPLPRTDRDYLLTYMPYAGESLAEVPSLAAYIRAALTSTLMGFHARGPRMANRRRSDRVSRWKALDVLYRLRESLRSRVAVKFVRGHLLIPALHQSFNPTVIHLRRDPRAIVSSLQRATWRWYEGISLEKQLLDPDDGRAKHFRAWTDDILRLDQAEPLMRAVAYWALLERFVDKLPDHPQRVSVSYEDLCLYPDRVLNDTFDPLFSNRIDAHHFKIESRTTDAKRKNVSAEDRVYGWKNELKYETIRDIEKIVGTFDLTEHLADPKT